MHVLLSYHSSLSPKEYKEPGQTHLLMPKILTVCICGAFAMSTASREQTFKSNGCSLKSEEFDAIMNLRTKRKTTLTTKCLSEWI